MRNFILLIALLFTSATSFSQIDSLGSKHDFYYLYNGKIILGDSLQYIQPVLGNAQICIGDSKFLADSIMFFKDQTGFYVNTKYSTTTYASEFAVRTISGKYNYFVQVSSKTYNKAKAAGQDLTTIPLKGKTYFSLGYNDPVPANSTNLYKSLHENSAAQADVKKLRNYNRLATAFLLGGAAAFTTGMLANALKKQDPNETYMYANYPALIGGGVGVALVATGVFIIAKSPSREEIIRKANSIY